MGKLTLAGITNFEKMVSKMNRHLLFVVNLITV
jgi:hypothetical protein